MSLYTQYSSRTEKKTPTKPTLNLKGNREGAKQPMTGCQLCAKTTTDFPGVMNTVCKLRDKRKYRG